MDLNWATPELVRSWGETFIEKRQQSKDITYWLLLEAKLTVCDWLSQSFNCMTFCVHLQD